MQGAPGAGAGLLVQGGGGGGLPPLPHLRGSPGPRGADQAAEVGEPPATCLATSIASKTALFRPLTL